MHLYRVSTLPNMARQITKKLICLWKGCDDVVEDAAAFKGHADKHMHEQMQKADLDNGREDGTEKQQKDKQLAIKPNLNEDKMANGVADIGKRRKLICMDVVVWTDVLGFVRRIQLARTVSLTNLQVHNICWPRLHGNKVMAHEVGHMEIARRDAGWSTTATLRLDHWKDVPFANCPPFDYITGFRDIQIKFLDQQVLAFFTHILPCVAKSGVSVDLNFMGSNANQCALLDQLLNLFRDGLPQDKLLGYCCLRNIQYLPDIDNKMQMINLSLSLEAHIPILMKMLASPRPDGRQRVLRLSSTFFAEYLELIRIIKKDFHFSIQPLAKPFYICFDRTEMRLELQSSVETNERTGEQLTIMPMPTTDDNANLHIHHTF